MNKAEIKKQQCFCSKLVMEECPKCGGNVYLLAKNEKEYLLTKQIVEGVKKVINSSQSGYEKRIALFNFLESLDVGELKPIEKERVDYLLKSCLYGDLAKKNLEKYKKLTAEDFSKTE